MGWIKGLIREFQLAWQLINDPRVPLLTKVLPLFTLVYLLSPVDLVPGLIIPGLGQLDDVAILLIGLRLFVDLSPPQIVAEHRSALERGISGWRPQGPIIDVEIEPEDEG
jgi:uncharacterized membrane protein YkvA (DUF1232 family)